MRRRQHAGAQAPHRAACSRRARARAPPPARRRPCTSRRRRRTRGSSPRSRIHAASRAHARGGIAAGRPRMRRARPVRVQSERRARGGAAARARASAPRPRRTPGPAAGSARSRRSRPAGGAAARRSAARPRRRAAARRGRTPWRLNRLAWKAHCRACAGSADSIRRPDEPQPALVDEMRARIRHRGPDQGSTDAFGPCVLGHQRLQVLDPELGYQPVANETGDVIAVFNGELYNFAELRAGLRRGHEVRGRGDTPVIPHLYEEYGVRLRRAPRRHVRDRALGRAAAAARARARPARQEAARLDAARRRHARVRVRAEGVATACPASAREPDLAALDAYLALGYVPGHAHRRCSACSGSPPGSLLVVESGREHDRALLGSRRSSARRRERRRVARARARRR